MKKTVVITGGSSGIGLSLVKKYCDKKYNVEVIDINDCKFFIQILYDILMNDDNNDYPDYIKDSIFELFYKIVSDESNMHIENKQNYCKQMNIENSINKINNDNSNDNTEFLRGFSNRVLVPLVTRQDD